MFIFLILTQEVNQCDTNAAFLQTLISGGDTRNELREMLAALIVLFIITPAAFTKEIFLHFKRAIKY